MAKPIIFLIYCLLFTFCNCLTLNHTIQLTGGWCHICGGSTGNYACSNEIYGGWKDYFIFDSQSPENHVVTEVKMYLTGEWSCSHDYSTISAEMQTTQLGVYNASGLCFCGMCDETLVYRWKQLGKCFPAFSYNGPNLVRIDVKYGLICLSKIDVEITYSPGNPVTCGCGNIGMCTHGHMRCVDEYSYQTCTLDRNGIADWGRIQNCSSGLTCNSTDEFIYCNRVLLSQLCTPGQMKCINNQSYQTCSTNQNGQTFWQTTQYCQPGLVCNPDPSSNTVMCVPQQYVTGLSGNCTPQTMRCVTNTTYQMCDQLSIWHPIQKCADQHFCSPNGNVIYCVTQLPSNCTYGNRRCVSNRTYQVCDRNTDSTYWNVEQSCQPSLTCHQQNDNIYCY